MPLPSLFEDYASQQFSHLREQQPVIAQWNSDPSASAKKRYRVEQVCP